MANNNDILVLRKEFDGVEYFTIKACGTSFVSKKGAVKLSGLTSDELYCLLCQNHLKKTFENSLDSTFVESLTLPILPPLLKKAILETNRPDGICYLDISHGDVEGYQTLEEINDKIFLGDTDWHYRSLEEAGTIDIICETVLEEVLVYGAMLGLLSSKKSLGQLLSATNHFGGILYHDNPDYWLETRNSRKTCDMGLLLHKVLKDCSPSKSNQPEKEIQLRLKEELNAEDEVLTPAGRIDLLSKNQLIEIKQVKQWKSGIGQLLCYGQYFPSHQLRLHLFGEHRNKKQRQEILTCTKALEINVTWE